MLIGGERRPLFPGIAAGISVFGLAIGVHALLLLLYWYRGPKGLWGDENRYMAAAGALLEGDPAWWPEPLWPPLNPHFLAGVMSLLGDGMAAVHLAQTALLFRSTLMLGLHRLICQVRIRSIGLSRCLEEVRLQPHRPDA